MPRTINFEITDQATLALIYESFEKRASATIQPVLDLIGDEHHKVNDPKELLTHGGGSGLAQLCLIDNDKSLFSEERMKALGFRYGKSWSPSYRGWYPSHSAKGRELGETLKEIAPEFPWPWDRHKDRLKRAILKLAGDSIDCYSEGFAFGIGYINPNVLDGRFLFECHPRHWTSESESIAGMARIKASEYHLAKESIEEGKNNA